jgi:bifunctional non-homologous end joining protein LigD
MAATVSRVEVTHPDKVLFPADGITKRDLVTYYERVAGVMVPHVRDRPVSMERFPEGIDKPGFIQMDVRGAAPPWLQTITVPKRYGTVTHVLANSPAALAWLANQAVITLHVWTSRADRLDRPDRMIFDFDPGGGDFTGVRKAARALGALLRDLGLEPFAMTTGSRGLHVTVPLRRTAGYDTVREAAFAIAGTLVARAPHELTIEARKAKRGDRIYIDCLRNGWAQTAVAPYAVRARPGAPVATPLRWQELSNSRLRPDGWTLRTIGRRLARIGDPWADIAAHAHGLSEARRALGQR